MSNTEPNTKHWTKLLLIRKLFSLVIMTNSEPKYQTLDEANCGQYCLISENYVQHGTRDIGRPGKISNFKLCCKRRHFYDGPSQTVNVSPGKHYDVEAWAKVSKDNGKGQKMTLEIENHLPNGKYPGSYKVRIVFALSTTTGDLLNLCEPQFFPKDITSEWVGMLFIYSYDWCLTPYSKMIRLYTTAGGIVGIGKRTVPAVNPRQSACLRQTFTRMAGEEGGISWTWTHRDRTGERVTWVIALCYRTHRLSQGGPRGYFG